MTVEIISDNMPPVRPERFTRDLKVFDNTLYLKWAGRFWQIWRKAPSGRNVHILNIERDGEYVQPGDWIFHLLHKMDMATFKGGVTEFLNKLDAENEERERRERERREEEQIEATEDALWSKAMKELEDV